MTDRSLTAGVIAETESATVIGEVLFLELLTTVPVYAWTGLGTRTLAMPGEASRNWTGLGTIGSVEAVVESADRRRNGVITSLSGIDSDILALALTEEYQGKSAKIWQAFMDSTGSIIPDPTLLFAGTMDTMKLVDGAAQGTIILQSESREQLLQRASRSLLTDQEQQALYPGDLGLEFVTSIQSKQIIWGATGTSGTSGIGAGGPRGNGGRLQV